MKIYSIKLFSKIQINNLQAHYKSKKVLRARLMKATYLNSEKIS